MNERHWNAELSDYLNDDLPASERLKVEAHLTGCRECRALLEDLRAVVARARSMGASPPDKDLWPDIASAIEGMPRDHERVLDLSPRLAGRLRSVEVRRRVSLTVPQLVAASAAMMIASGAMAWWLRPATQAFGAVSEERESVAVPASLADRPSLSGYTQEVAQLEALIAEHRDELSPKTVRVLDKNLAIIDRAIEESGEALAADPGNEYLLEHLGHAMERKVEYLRDASAISGWVTS